MNRVRLTPESPAVAPARNGKHPGSGRFLPGNRAAANGRGKEYREAVRDVVTPERLRAIFDAIASRAEKGNIHAAKFIAEYVIGRPTYRVDMKVDTEAEIDSMSEAEALAHYLNYEKYA